MTNNEIISVLGGTSQVAKLCGVSMAAVAQWKRNGIPKDRLIYIASQLEIATKGEFSRKKEFPDIYRLIWTDL